MYGIACAVLLGFVVLLLLSRKETVPSQISSLLKPCYKIASYLYKRLCHWIPRLFASAQVERDLAGLHPGVQREALKLEYYARKGAICLAVVLAGTLFGTAAKYSSETQIILGEDGTIVRGDYRDGPRKISIETEYGQRRMDFRLEVEPKLLSGEMAESLFRDLKEKLPEYILGQNESLHNVVTDLRLQEKYGEFPISVKWESSNPGILSDAGQIFSVEEAESLKLSFRMSYGGYEQDGELSVTVRPPELGAEDRLYMEMEELLLQSQSGSVEEDEWRLPLQWQGESIHWKQVVEDNSLLLWGAAVATALTIFLFLDRDLHEQMEKRKKALHLEYPEIVHKLVLFVGAGLTVRGAFQKIAGDYETKRAEGDSQSPAYEEVLYTCRELRSGISEGLCYEHFGKRAGPQEYIRLSALLAQNLKRGNSTLLERLREEADKAAEEKLQQGKKLGEEAGTKLLVPMVLMLAVVMAIIMVPAFSNM